MFGRKVMSSKSVLVKFDGQVEEVDLNTFTRVLLDYTSVIRAVGSQVDSNCRFDTNIRAVRPGCLVVDLGVVSDGIGALFADPSTTLDTIAQTITIASGFYGFVRFLGKHGKMSSAENGGNETRVTAEDGAVTNVPTMVVNVYANCPDATQAVVKTFSTLDDDGRISAIQLSTDEGSSFRAERDEFPDLASAPQYEGPEINHIQDDCTLVVVKPVLAKTTKRKWEFVWRGSKISANITDQSFIERLDSEAFTIGSTIEATLDITQRYDKDSKAFLNSSFTVTEVHSTDRPPQDRPLF